MKPPDDKLRGLVIGVTRQVWKVVLILLFSLGLPETVAAADDHVPTFTKNVAPLLSRSCVKCHRAGELASRVPLTSYETVQPRAEMIKQKVVTRQMPPWPADPARSLEFRNDARLSQQDIDTIVSWVDAGAPKGNDADLPPLSSFSDGWVHPRGLKPDLVISLPTDTHIPASGTIPYQRWLVKVPLSEDKWIAASQTRAGNPLVVHHMAMTEIALPAGMSDTLLNALTGRMGLPNTVFDFPAVTTPSRPTQGDMLGMYTPGTTLEMYRVDTGKLLKGGNNMYLIFDIHYETTGKPETDRSSMAFWFLPGPPQHQLFRVNGAAETIIANGKELLTDAPGTKAEGTNAVIPPIPPFADNYELTGITAYPEAVTIYQLQPHAHHRGKDFTYVAVYPDGREQTLLSVPRYDHRWQMAFELETPLELPAGSKLVVTAHYDNSTRNMHNPSPEKDVYFRDQNQSWDEMFTPFIQYSIDDQNPANPLMKALEPHRGGGESNSPRPERTPGQLAMGEVVGCLRASPTGNWLLVSATEATISETQASSSVALKAAAAKPLGSLQYRLLGVGAFRPTNLQGEKVAVKGIVIEDSHDARINVTSLQGVATRCAE